MHRCIHGICHLTVFTKGLAANIIAYLTKLLISATETIACLRDAGAQCKRYIEFWKRGSTVLRYHKQYHGKHDGAFEPGGLIGAARGLQKPMALGNESNIGSAHSHWKCTGGPLHRKMPTESALWSIGRTLLHPRERL